MRIVRLGASYINAVRLIYGSIFKPNKIGVTGLKFTYHNNLTLRDKEKTINIQLGHMVRPDRSRNYE